MQAVGEKFSADLKKAMAFLSDYSIRGIGTRVDIKLNARIVGDRALPQALEECTQTRYTFLPEGDTE